jgi:hypothetical protein
MLLHPRACPDPVASAPYVVAVVVSSYAACLVTAWVVANHIYQRVTRDE